MKSRLVLIFIILACICLSGVGQNRVIDSLRNLLKAEKEDTNKVKTLNNLAFSLININPDTTILLAGQAGALAVKLGWKTGEGNAYNNAGMGYTVKGDYTNSIANFLKSLKTAEEIKNKELQAGALSNIGGIYQDQSDYPKAFDYYQQALKIGEELGNKKLQANNLGNIGIIYWYQGDYPKALDYDLKALKIKEDIGNKQGQANTLSNIGLIYTDQGDYPKALDYDMKALAMGKEIKNKKLQASVLGNIGLVYNQQANYDKALDYYLMALKMNKELGNKQGQASNHSNIGLVCDNMAKAAQAQHKIALSDSLNKKALANYIEALKMAQEIGYKRGIAINLGNIGSFYIKTGKFKEALEYLNKAIELDQNIGDQNSLRQYEEKISLLYDTTGHYKLALDYYKKAMVLKDTLFNADKNKALTRKEVTFQFESKEAAEKAEQDKKEAVAEQDKKRQTAIRNAFMIGFALTLALAFFIFRGYRQKQKDNLIITRQKLSVEQKNIIIEKQKQLVEHQKALVEEKNKDILDSITYAKRLQDAILPPLSLIKQYLPEFFLLYKPKDIVAGDFYWMEQAGDNILIAAADCTGHGVPGAMVSVVCSNALNRTVKEFKITEPGKILDKVRGLVLETFEKSEDNVQDGMDISLCCINTKTKEAQWSGAYNSLWYIRNGEVIEVPADKQPIGKADKPVPFNTHNLILQKGDTLYLFTDGYADQFGGPKGKKYKYKQLQELLLANATKSMEEQKNMLESSLNEWKGELEQVDDILVIGIRI